MGEHAAESRKPRRILLCHAIGFCKDVWAPFVDELRALAGDSTLACEAINFRGHGGRPPPDAPLTSWEPFRDDVLEAVGADRGIVGVGHSMGGASLVSAELARPGTFSKLILFEPIVFPPVDDEARGNKFASLVARRRKEWPSVADARANLAGRGAFKAWDRRALDAYLAGGLVAAGDAVALACAPQYESSVYLSRTMGSPQGWDDAWARLGELRCDVVIACGAASQHADGFPGFESTAALYAAMGREANGARVSVLPDVGHFAPMEAPAAYARHVWEAVGVGARSRL